MACWQLRRLIGTDNLFISFARLVQFSSPRGTRFSIMHNGSTSWLARSLLPPRQPAWDALQPTLRRTRDRRPRRPPRWPPKTVSCGDDTSLSRLRLSDQFNVKGIGGGTNEVGWTRVERETSVCLPTIALVHAPAFQLMVNALLQATGTLQLRHALVSPSLRTRPLSPRVSHRISTT